MLIDGAKTRAGRHSREARLRSVIGRAFYVALMAVVATLALAAVVAWRSLLSLVSLPIL